MRYILLGSDKPKVYIKDCKETKGELCISKETDFVREEQNCTKCLYYIICCLPKKRFFKRRKKYQCL
jgi:hypothetical protein